MAIWRSGDNVDCVNEVAVRPARLVPRWVTISVTSDALSINRFTNSPFWPFTLRYLLGYLVRRLLILCFQSIQLVDGVVAARHDFKRGRCGRVKRLFCWK